MIAAGDCDAGVFMPPIIIITPGFLIVPLTVSIPVTGRTVSRSSTLNITSCRRSWFSSNTPGSYTGSNTQILFSGLMLEYMSATAVNVRLLVNSK